LRLSREIDFMGFRRKALLVSALAVALSLGMLLLRGLNWGIDFAGGELLQLEFESPIELEKVRSAFAGVGQGGAVLQKYSEVGLLAKTREMDEGTRRKLLGELKGSVGPFQVLRMEKVGPVVGEELRRQALLAIGVAILGILVYVALRFNLRFAVPSVLCLVHDSLVVLGFFSLLQREISLPFVAAILTIVGYSLNDTIVVFDRIREDMRGRGRKDVVSLVNGSINRVLSRTINTSLTTLFPVLILFLFGGEIISDFALAFLVGIVVGTYSSVFVASALLVEWELRRG